MVRREEVTVWGWRRPKRGMVFVLVVVVVVVFTSGRVGGICFLIKETSGVLIDLRH